MGDFNVPILSGEESPDDLIQAIARMQKMLNWIMQGKLSSTNIRELTADKIKTGTLDAGLVTVRADLDGGAYIQMDSAGGLVINDGTKDTFHADINGLVTMIGALIQSSTGYPRIELNSADNLFGAYKDADHALLMRILEGPEIPTIEFRDVPTNKSAYVYFNPNTIGFSVGVQGSIDMTATDGSIAINATGGGSVSITGLTVSINGTPINSTLVSLQSQINSLQSQINSLDARVSALESA